MDAEIDKALKLLLKDAGFETEKTVAVFDENTWSVNVYFKNSMGGWNGRSGWDIVRYLKANGLFAAEFIKQVKYNVFNTFLQIQMPPSFGFKDRARLGGKPWRCGTSF